VSDEYFKLHVTVYSSLPAITIPVIHLNLDRSVKETENWSILNINCSVEIYEI